MKTIKGALGIDPGRTMRIPMGQPPAKGSGMLGQYHRQQQMMNQPPPPIGGPMYAPQGQPPMTGGPMFAPQQGAGIGNFMQNQVGAMSQGAPQFNQPNPYAQAMQTMQGQMYTNAARQAPQSVGDMTAQQRNPNYIQGR